MSGRREIAIIGGGLGGLACGVLLSKFGHDVLLLEKGRALGGALQTFHRAGHPFDTGFHYTGAVGAGESQHRLMQAYSLDNLDWVRLDDDIYEQVWLEDRRYDIAQGYEGFRESLSSYFPEEREALGKFIARMRTMEYGFASAESAGMDLSDPVFNTSAYEWMKELFHNRDLISVIGATCLKCELSQSLSLYAFIHMMQPFIQGSYRLRGGGNAIIERLAGQIRDNGGEIRTCCAVKSILEKDGAVDAVELENGETIPCSTIISDAHPAITLSLVKGTESISGLYRRRIGKLQNSFGIFTVNCILEPGSQDYINKGLYVYRKRDIWDTTAMQEGVCDRILVNFPSPDKGSAKADSVDILSPMLWSSVEKWDGTAVGKRGDEYASFKKSRAQECLELAERAVPGLNGCIKDMWTSTPLTYKDYTGTFRGSAFGVMKDCSSPLTTFISPKTPLGNLYLTGQNISLHGITGVLMAGIQTCVQAGLIDRNDINIRYKL